MGKTNQHGNTRALLVDGADVAFAVGVE